MDPILAIPLAIVLLLIAALSSAAEGALAALSRGEVADIAESTVRGRQRLTAISEHHRGHQDALALAQIGAMTVLGAGTALMLNQLWANPWLSLIAASGLLLLTHILLIGSFPRTFGVNRPRPTIILLSRLIRVNYHVLGWVSELLGTIGDVFVPASRVGVNAPASEEQLLSMVDEAAELDVLADEDRDRIHSVLGFSDRLVREVMIPRTDMRTVDAGTPAVEAVRVLLDQGISRAPIIGRDNDDVRGIAYLKDLANTLASGTAGHLSVDNVARPAVFVPETVSADELLRQMQQDATHFAIVVDEYGGVAGLVTLEDLIEELVGEISDEHDRIDLAWDRLEDGSIRVATRMAISDLEELLDDEFEHDDVDSVGGLFTNALDRIPVLADRGQIGEYVFIADRVGRKHHVTHVRILRANGRPLRVTAPEDETGLPGGSHAALPPHLDAK